MDRHQDSGQVLSYFVPISPVLLALRTPSLQINQILHKDGTTCHIAFVISNVFKIQLSNSAYRELKSVITLCGGASLNTTGTAIINKLLIKCIHNDILRKPIFQKKLSQIVTRLAFLPVCHTFAKCQIHTPLSSRHIIITMSC